MLSALLSRFGSWLLQTIVVNSLDWLRATITKAILDWKERSKKKSEMKKAEEQAQAVLANPEATAEERAKAYESLINTSSKQ